MNDEAYLEQAITASKESVATGGFPAGSIVVFESKIIAKGISNGKATHDPTNHAEIAAIRAACQTLQTRNLSNVVLYSSLEPCLMCFAAASWASIQKIVYAARRNMVSKQHFEGNHELTSLNASLRHPIELIYIPKLEQEALQVIETWESKQ